MGFIQSDLDAINAAIGSGAREVQYATHKVVYNSLKDLIAARVLIEADVTGKRRSTRRIGVFFKDY